MEMGAGILILCGLCWWAGLGAVNHVATRHWRTS